MFYVIYNPASQSGNGIKIWHQVKAVLDSANKEYRVYKTTPERNGMHIAKSLLEKTGKENIDFMVLGGDGSVNDVIQAFSEEDFDRVRFYYIPTGSSNDFARSVGFEKDTEALTRHVINVEKPRNVDVGVLNYNKAETLGYTKRYFLCSCGMGFDASVCAEAMDSKDKAFLNKIGLGKLSYLYITLKQLFSAPNAKVEILDENNMSINIDRCIFVASMNEQYQGGGLPFCPGARDNDGYLDICYAGGISKLRVLFSLPFLMKGKHIGLKGIHGTRVKSLRIISNTPLHVHTDGEVKTKATDVTVSLMPGKLMLMY